jgi:hypothetical protein
MGRPARVITFEGSAERSQGCFIGRVFSRFRLAAVVRVIWPRTMRFVGRAWRLACLASSGMDTQIYDYVVAVGGSARRVAIPTGGTDAPMTPIAMTNLHPETGAVAFGAHVRLATVP